MNFNTSRAEIFKAILEVVTNPSESQTDNLHARLFHNNVRAVTEELVSALNEVTNSRLNAQAPAEIARIVQGMGMEALRMGSQRAHIFMESCDHGDLMDNMDRFRDDNASSSRQLTVDIMTQPCIRRVGDGRDDLRLQRVIIKGDFVSRKTSQSR